MTRAGSAEAGRRRALGHLVLWALAILGVALLAASAPVQDANSRLAIGAQPALLATIGIVFGALLARDAGVRSAIVDGGPLWPRADRAATLLFCGLGAVLGAGATALASTLADAGAAAALGDPRLDVGAAVGGLAFSALTEEATWRWGATTAMVWAFSAIAPRRFALAAGVAVAALLYAVAPLPGLIAVAPEIGVDAILFVSVRNILSGLLFGAAFVLVRLEAAMAAHASAHLAAVATGVLLLGVDLG